MIKAGCYANQLVSTGSAGSEQQNRHNVWHVRMQYSSYYKSNILYKFKQFYLYLFKPKPEHPAIKSKQTSNLIIFPYGQESMKVSAATAATIV